MGDTRKPRNASSTINGDLSDNNVKGRTVPESLADEHHLLRTLIDGLPDFIFVKDTESRFVILNQAQVHALGAASPEELIGKTVFDIFPEDLAQQYFIDEQAVIRSGRPLVGREEPIIDAAGTQSWLSTTRVPVEDRQGNIVGLAGMSRDITRHKEIEEALRQSNRERALLNRASQAFASTLSLAQVAHLVIEKAVQAIKAHSAVLTLLDEKGNVDLAFGPAEPPPQPAGARLTVFKTGQPLVIGDGQSDTVRMPEHLRQEGIEAAIGLPLKTGERTIGVLFVRYEQPHHFSEREVDLLFIFAYQAAIAIENARLHQETRKQARQVRQILDTVPEGIVLLDGDYRVKLVNPSADAYLAELAGVGMGDVLTDLGGQSLDRLLRRQGPSHWHEVRLAGSPQRVFEVSLQPMETGTETEEWLLVLREVTQEREIQAQLQQQDRLAAVGELAAGLAHDFNNIIASVSGYAELVTMDPQLSDFARDNLGRMIEQSKQATYLIRQMLDFSRRSVIEKSPMDLVAFVEEIIDLLQPTLSNNIELTLEIEPGHDSFPIDGDPAQLQRVVTNLAVNARDAMPDGGKLQFRLSCLALEPGEPAPRPEMAPGEWLTLSISDTGAGISSDVLPHIFEPFFTTKEVGQGTGLGLAQVYGIVKQHGGDIAVTSQEGQGTTFSLYLPA